MQIKSKINHLIYEREIIQKLWQSFRIGQTTYIAYGIALINFTLILYRLAGIDKYIDPIPFAIILIFVLIPSGIALGIFHIRHQMPTENKTMTNYNPYVFQVVPGSKESMSLKNSIWNFDVAQINNNFMLVQSEMNKKLWTSINELTGKKIFDDDDFKKMDLLKNNFVDISEGLKVWKQRYEQLYNGKSVRDIKNVEEHYNEHKKDNNI